MMAQKMTQGNYFECCASAPYALHAFVGNLYVKNAENDLREQIDN